MTKLPLSKRAAEPPVISLEQERSKRTLKQIREENERKIKEQGLDKPPEYAGGARFFGEVFLPGDFIVTKKEPGRVWRVLEREDSGRLGIAYKVQSADEALIWATDVARGMKGGHLLELPESEWNTPGKGMPPEKPKWADPEEQAARKQWDRLQPLAAKLMARLEKMDTDDAKEARTDIELQLEHGYKDSLSPEHLTNALRQGYWALKGVPFSKGWERQQKVDRRKEIQDENKRHLDRLAPHERAQEEINRQKWDRLKPLAEKLIRKLKPKASKQERHEHPRWEMETLRKQLEQGYKAGLVHQFENAIREAYWALRGVPAQEGWKRMEERRKKNAPES
jgi:hypothetical protein